MSAKMLRSRQLDKDALSTHQVQRFVKLFLEAINSDLNFLGVFAFDLLPASQFFSSFSSPPTKPHQCHACIVNTDPSSLPGQHWVSFYRDIDKLEFFDSYGQPPSTYGFPIPESTSVLKNNIQLQSFNSSVCGHYCILFIFLRALLNSVFPLRSNSFSNFFPLIHYHCLSVNPNPVVALNLISRSIQQIATSSTLRDRRVKTLIFSLVQKFQSKNRAHLPFLHYGIALAAPNTTALAIALEQTACPFNESKFIPKPSSLIPDA